MLSLLEYCQSGLDEGATLVYGGKQVDRPGWLYCDPSDSFSVYATLSVSLPLIPLTGYFMEPTIFADVEDHMFIAKEESFGPVMIISVFENGSVQISTSCV